MHCSTLIECYTTYVHVCVYGIHCTVCSQYKVHFHNIIHCTQLQWWVNVFGLALLGPFLHSSLIFNYCTVEFLTCTKHSENHVDPLVQSLTFSNSKTKLEAAILSNTRRTFYGYSIFSHAMANTQTPMLWRGESIPQRTKLPKKLKLEEKPKLKL